MDNNVGSQAGAAATGASASWSAGAGAATGASASSPGPSPGTTVVLEARAVVNAAGPWVDALRHRAGIAGPPRVRPSRGAHLVVPALTGGRALLLFARADGRVFFVVPWGTHSLVGTTDTDESRDPEDAAPTSDDIAYLRGEIAARWPERTGAPESRAFAGVRPLLAEGRGGPSAAGGTGAGTIAPWRNSREARILEEQGVFSIVGGKYTTARRLAEQTVDRVVAALGRRTAPCTTATAPLPLGARRDAALAALRARYPETLATTAPAAPTPGAAPAAATPGAAHAPFGRAEVEFAIEHELATTAADVIWRRSPLWLDRAAARAAAGPVAEWMGERLGWSAARIAAEADAVRAACDAEDALLKSSPGDRPGAPGPTAAARRPANTARRP